MKTKPPKKTATTKKHFTVGIDLGDKSHAVCVLEEGSDEAVHRETVENTKDAMSRSLGGSAKVGGLAVVEAGAQSAWTSRHLSEMGFEVIIADARKLRVIATSYTKNDKNDAEVLARLGRADASIFSPVVHRGEQAQRDLAILKGRDALVRMRTGAINHVRGILKGFGIKRAVVAVARKLAVTMASLWESGQDYVDFPGGKPPGPTTGKPETLGDCGAAPA